MRELDDNESDSSKGISKRVIALLKDNDTWVEATKKLPDLLMADIEDSGAKKEIKIHLLNLSMIQYGTFQKLVGGTYWKTSIGNGC